VRVVNEHNTNLWQNVESALAEHSANGYKIACIEAEKVFRYLLKSKGYPIADLENLLVLYGWKLTDREGLKKALKKNREIKDTFEYQLSSFEAEDIVETFKQAIADFSDAKTLGWQKRFILFYQNYISLKSSFAKKLTIGLLGFFLIVKFLARTSFGNSMTAATVRIADFIYSWFLFFLILAFGLFLLVLVAFSKFDNKKTRIKSIKDKN
jgi:hypothetical protein